MALNGESASATRGLNFSISNSWVYGIRRDLFLTVAIFLIAYVIHGVSDIQFGMLEVAILPVLFDQNHVLMTYARVYFDQEEFASKRALYLLVPLFSLTLAIALVLTSEFWFLAVYGNLSLFHFIRQQYGWLMITAKKNLVLAPWELRLNKLFFYNLTVMPLLFYFSSDSYKFEWIGPMLPVANFLEKPILYTFFLILGVTVLYEGWVVAKSKRLNLAKYNQYFIAFVSWFGVHYFLNNLSLTYAVLIVSHGLSYWYINFFIMSKKWSHRGGHFFFSYWFSGPSLFLFLACVTFFYWNVSGLNQGMARHFLAENWYFMMVIPATVSWTHYILDGFIWSARKNKSVRKYIVSPAGR